MKRIVFVLFLLFPALAFSQVLKTAAVPYTKGASPYTPNTATSSEIRVDTASSCLYWWNRDALTWVRFYPGIDVVTGSSAPAYTPGNNQSLFAVNADNELFYYTGAAWVQVGGSTGSGGIYAGSGTTGAAYTTATIDSIMRFYGDEAADRFIAVVGAGSDQSSVTIVDTAAYLLYDEPDGSNLVEANNEGILLSTNTNDRTTITGKDARYSADYSATYSARSLIDKGYADATYSAAADISGGADEVAVFSSASELTSYPEMTFDGTVLQLGGDVSIEKNTPTLDIRATEASGSSGGGLLNLAAIDGSALASGDRLGAVQFAGQTGVGSTAQGASIEAFAMGTWGSNDAPAELRFFTTPDGTETPAERMKLTMTGDVGIKKNSAGATQDVVSVSAYGSESNLGFAIAPKGTGGILASIPDGTATGGNARGNYAVDLQTQRTNASDVASGNYSTIPGGRRCTASGTYSFATGFRAVASGAGSVCFGGSGSLSTGASATGSNSFAFGTGADATANGAIAFRADASAENSVAFLNTADKYGEFAGFAGWSFMQLSKSFVVGTAATELFLDGSSLTATIPTDEKWIVEAACFAEVKIVGNGTGGLAVGDIYAATYRCVIANIGGTTALVGTVQNDMAAQSAATMSDVVFTITADNTGDYLKVTYTGGANTGSTTQTRAYAVI